MIEGLYSLNYKLAGAAADSQTGGDALAALRCGRVLGSDRWGGVFDGSYCFNSAAGKSQVHIELQLPPDGVLVTGYSAGAGGAVITIDAELDIAGPVSTSTIEVDGQPVELRLSYVGPLP